MRWLLWLVVALSLVRITDVAEPNDVTCSMYGNGCSTYGLYAWYLELFKLPCDRHDVCYACGSAFSISRAECDEAFIHDMQAACVFGSSADHTVTLADNLEPGVTWDTTVRTCVEASHNFYIAVRGLGWLFFKELGQTPDFCFQPWVKRCFPPAYH